MADGAHVVVTSYTLFRLEHADYAALPWAGLILDEAQFVKNAASQACRCAKQLPVGFKLAVTGTPLENNLSELWALLSITAPGLLSRLDRFTDYYRRPIEKDRHAERLAQLRRRIRPLMLRRRKSEVAGELPAKQEQIVMPELNSRHRRVDQTYLQRERGAGGGPGAPDRADPQGDDLPPGRPGHHRGEGDGVAGRKAELFGSVLDGGEFASAALTAEGVRTLLG